MPIRIPKADPAVVRLFDSLVPASPTVTRRLMFGQPAAFANGHLFFGVFGTRLFVRLSAADVITATSREGFGPFEPMPGRVMGGYALLPLSVLEDRARTRRWVARALEHASGLPPKSGRKKVRASTA